MEIHIMTIAVRAIFNEKLNIIHKYFQMNACIKYTNSE